MAVGGLDVYSLGQHSCTDFVIILHRTVRKACTTTMLLADFCVLFVFTLIIGGLHVLDHCMLLHATLMHEFPSLMMVFANVCAVVRDHKYAPSARLYCVGCSSTISLDAFAVV